MEKYICKYCGVSFSIEDACFSVDGLPYCPACTDHEMDNQGFYTDPESDPEYNEDFDL